MREQTLGGGRNCSTEQYGGVHRLQLLCIVDVHQLSVDKLLMHMWIHSTEIQLLYVSINYCTTCNVLLR